MGTNFYEDNQFTISIHYLTALAMNTTAFDCAICDPYTGACRADLGICLCRAYWGGDDCSESIIANNAALSRYFLAHIIIFCGLFGGIFAFGLAEIVILCRGSKLSVNKPTLLMFITCVFVGAERIVFLAVFRYGQVKELAYVGSTLMEGIVIWAIVFMHSLVLLFWFGAYISTIPRKSYLVKRVRIAVICVVIFFLLLELARDIVYGILPLTFKQIVPLQIVTQIIVALIVLPSAIILLVFGTKLTKELSKFKELSKARRRLINRINNFAKSICGSVLAVVAVIIVLRLINVTTEREYPAVSMAILSLARLMEVLYCFMILITYHREVKTPEQSTTSSQSGPMAISTAGGNTASGDDVQLTSR